MRKYREGAKSGPQVSPVHFVTVVLLKGRRQGRSVEAVLASRAEKGGRGSGHAGDAHIMDSTLSDIWGVRAGVHIDHNARHQVLPVFVYDVGEVGQPLLLSDGAKVAAFPNMVVAVSGTRLSFCCPI